jgi:hypothetical protein
MRWSEEKMEPDRRSPRADWPRGVDGDPLIVWPSPSGPRAARCYVSQAVLQNRKDEAGSIARVAAPDIEELVVAALRHQVMDGSRAGDGFSFRLFEAERHDGVEPRGSMSRIEAKRNAYESGKSASQKDCPGAN